MRDRTHWNSANIKPVDPVTLGLVTQLELDAVVKMAAEKKAKDDARKAAPQPEGATLRTAAEPAPEPERAAADDEDDAED